MKVKYEDNGEGEDERGKESARGNERRDGKGEGGRRGRRLVKMIGG